MEQNNIYLSIISLTKNQDEQFLKTLQSIQSQLINFQVEWLIIDGSNQIIIRKNSKYINKFLKRVKKDSFYVRHINSTKKKITGIYPCMNYAKKISKGKFLIFLNCGDIFYDKNSLNILYQNSKAISSDHSMIFGQAKIISPSNIQWNFPGNRLSNIDNWLKIFEPNHQAMLISKKLAKKFDYSLEHNSLGDGLWKRKIINNASEIIYIKKPVIKFFLDGVSSVKPSPKVFKDILKNKKISFIRKLVYLIKYIFPPKLFFIFHLLQKYKSNFVDYIF